jgi:glutathione S-transferase
MTGFLSLRNECSCALFARVPSFQPVPDTRKDIERVFEIWSDCLTLSGGPYLFGAHFGIVDCMYYPVITRFRTYGIQLPTDQIKAYVEAVERTPSVEKLVAMAKKEPGITIYDDYIRKLGGDPKSVL